jgi:hypothetical protein
LITILFGRHCRACPGNPAFFDGMDAQVEPGHGNLEGKSARSANAALRDWQDTIADRALCKHGAACHYAPPPEHLPCTPPIDT